MKHIRAFGVLALLAGLTGTAPVDAQAHRQVHEYLVPNHGKLSLSVPEGLRDFSQTLSEPASVLLRFRPQSGDAFYVQVTTVWFDSKKLAKATPEAIRANVASSAAEPLRHAVEKELLIKELRGAETRGYYYSLTDRAPGPGEYKYLSQGSFLTGELMTAFTILYREPVCPEKELVLQMFADAKYVK
ncbi:MAG: hypothetical protein ACHQKY_02485 [Terriglobia bacterium]